MIASTSAANGKVKVTAQIVVALAHRRQSPLQAHDDHRVLNRSSGQSGFDRHHCHRLVAGGLPMRAVGHKATLYRVDRAHHPLGWISDHREQFCPVPDLVTAQLKRLLQERIKQEESFFLGAVTESIQSPLGPACHNIVHALYHGDKAGTVESLVGPLVRVEKQVKEHAVKSADRTVHQLGNDDRLRASLSEGKLYRP